SVQVIVGLVGVAALLIGPAVLLVQQPGQVHDDVGRAGLAWSWLALLLATAAGAWHVGRTLVRARVHVLCGLGLATSVLLACSAAAVWDESGWLAYHVLTAACAATAAVTLGAGWLAARRSAEAPSAGLVRGWVAALGL